jgi:LDH2 family malate/lactate/ureidoglycolate dehydrogenase
METVSVAIKELKNNLCLPPLLRRGATAEDAEFVFDDYLDAEIRGRASHGFVSFNVALSQFPKQGTFQIAKQTETCVEIEGNGDCGHTVARKATDLGIDAVTQSGIFAIGLRNITRFNCPGSIARHAGKKGKIALVLEYGGKNFMVPHDGKRPALSTNPLGIAIPTGAGAMFVLDIATSERAIGYVALAKLMGETIPETWGVDENGDPTDNPSAFAATRPFGGYKGYALSLAFEILAGALVGVPIGSKGQLARRGALILLIDPTVFGHSEGSFSRQVSEFLAEVTRTPSVSGKPITYPGQRGEERHQEAMRHGAVELPAAVYEQLKTLSRQA